MNTIWINAVQYQEYVNGKYIPADYTLGSLVRSSIKYTPAKTTAGQTQSMSATFNHTRTVDVPGKPGQTVDRKLTVNINITVAAGYTAAEVAQITRDLAASMSPSVINRLSAGGYPVSADPTQVVA